MCTDAHVLWTARVDLRCPPLGQGCGGVVFPFPCRKMGAWRGDDSRCGETVRPDVSAGHGVQCACNTRTRARAGGSSYYTNKAYRASVQKTIPSITTVQGWRC